MLKSTHSDCFIIVQKILYTFEAYIQRICYRLLIVTFPIQTEYISVCFYSSLFSALLAICYHHIYRFAHIIVLRLFHIFFQFLQ